MKISTTTTTGFYKRGHGEKGMAVIVVIALFAIMLLFLASTLHTLNHLRQDLKLIERQQLERIRRSHSITNAAGSAHVLSENTNWVSVSQ